MKRFTASLCMLSLLLSGCSAAAQEMPTQPPALQSQTSPTQVPESAPLESTEETVAVKETTAPQISDADTQEQETAPAPEEPTQIPSESAPPQAVQPPAQNEPQAPAEKEPQAPAVNTPQQTPAQEGVPLENLFGETGIPGMPNPSKNDVLQLKQTAITIPLGGEGVIEYVYHGSGTLEWSSSSPTLLVKDQGTIIPSAEGEFFIYVTDGEYASAAYVTVTPMPEPVGDIYFEESEITMVERTSTMMEVKGDTFGDYVVYTSSDPSIVEASGSFFLAQRPGTAVITATHRGRQAQLTITVTMDPTVYRVDLCRNELTLCETDDSYQMTWYYTGSDALHWTTSDETVARVTEDGLVIPIAPGVCEIFLSDRCIGEGCTVTVTADPNKISATSMQVGHCSAPLYDGVVKSVGESMSFEVWTEPVGSECTIQITSSNPDVVSYYWETSQCVYLLFLSAGDATVTIQSSDGRFSESYAITVQAPLP